MEHWVTLTLDECIYAANIGIRRCIESMFAGHVHRVDDRNRAFINAVEGACGEAAFQKWLGVPIALTVNTFKSPDVEDMQVRTRLRSDFELFVRPDDRADERFVLVRGSMPRYQIVGYKWGWAAKDERWLNDHGNYGKAAYFVPDEALDPPEDLRGESDAKAYTR